MDNPKISVLLPLYNRKHYIDQCLDSALDQSFQDYEIIIRDNCSTDGGFEYVQEKYAQQISDGKIRLYLNEKNVGLWGSTKLLIQDAKGKYILFLHSDDMLLNHSLAHLHEIAEKTNADVVHEQRFFMSEPSGIINTVEDCRPFSFEKKIFDKVTIMPNDPISRFYEWFKGETFWDGQYNLFNKEFVIKNEIFIDEHDYYYSAFLWVMLAKVLVKTPTITYIRRFAPDSGTCVSISDRILEEYLSDFIRACKDFDKRFSKIELLKNDEYLQYMVKARYISFVDNCVLKDKKLYQNGITPHTYEIIKKIFQEYFGENYFYPMMLFNWIHTKNCEKRVDVINFNATDSDT